MSDQGSRDEGTGDEAEEALFEGPGHGDRDTDEFSDEPAFGEAALDEGAIEEGDERAAEEESEGPRRRGRRGRRRGRGERGPREERGHARPGEPTRPPRSEDEESDDDLEEDSGDLTGESELSADDEGEEGDAPRVYRNVPTWEEAISFLVHKRPSEGRSRDESGGGHPPRRDGGRPR